MFFLRPMQDYLYQSGNVSHDVTCWQQIEYNCLKGGKSF